MNNYEFISYEPTPDDKYIIGIVTVRVYGKIILRYKKIKTKNGNGEFFCPASYAIDKNGEKKYYICHMLDSRADDEMLMEFIREKVNSCSQKASIVDQPMQYYPNGTMKGEYEHPHSSNAVAPPSNYHQEELPF